MIASLIRFSLIQRLMILLLATALIAACIKTGDAATSARALRDASPHAKPNRRIIALADEVLNQNGALIAARESMGNAD